MFLEIYKKCKVIMNINIVDANNKFSFEIKDGDKYIYSSSRDGVVTSLKSHYNTSWEACYAARNFVYKYPFHLMHRKAYEVIDTSSGFAEGESVTVEKSAADILEAHYGDILESLTVKLRNPPKSEKDILHMSLTTFIMELSNLYQVNAKQGKKEEAQIAVKLLRRFKLLLNKKFGGKMAQINMQALNQKLNPKKEGGGGGLPGMASRKTFIITAGGDVLEEKINEEVVHELLEDYAAKVCSAICDLHNIVYKTEQNKDHYYIDIYELVNNNIEKILVIRINKFLNIDSIIPVGKLSKIYPYHSIYFYQKYWKPIVDKVGHFYLEDTNMLILSGKNELPDLPKNNKSYQLETWDISQNKSNIVEISFKKNETWFFDKAEVNDKDDVQKTASSRYTEQDYLNALVMCIDKLQPDLYGEIGQVVQVIPLEDMIEVDVKFITFSDEDSKIKKKQENKEPIKGLIVRMSEDKIKILDDNELSSLNLGI